MVTTTPSEPFTPQGVDLERPSVARVYDYYLGGTANWAVDRMFGDKVLEAFPLVKDIARANRVFLHRAVRYLAKQGVKQFIDIGSGVPSAGPTHEVVEEVIPDAKVVYIDYEPVAVAHSQIILEKTGDLTRHAAINADLRDPDMLWQKVRETGVIDFNEPVALLLIAVLHVEQPGRDGKDCGEEVLKSYRELLTSGSYLALSHITDQGVPSEIDQKLVDLKRMYDTSSSSNAIWRSHDQIRALFGDFEFVEPGLTWTPLWHPEEKTELSPLVELHAPNESAIYAGVARKP
jgi:hypothetical protein